MAGANNASSFKPKRASWSSTGAIDSATLITSPMSRKNATYAANFQPDRSSCLSLRKIMESRGADRTEHKKQKGRPQKGTRHTKRKFVLSVLCFFVAFPSTSCVQFPSHFGERVKHISSAIDPLSAESSPEHSRGPS